MTLRLGKSLAHVLGERVMAPLGASERWSWHVYRTSTIVLAGRQVEVVSGGAHWAEAWLSPPATSP